MDFVTQADWIPGFWNFLVDLDQQDLVAELVQNDLDQGATETSIDFQEDRIVAQGNGNPVDYMGWQRLSYIHGAGNDVPAKKSKIGVKNHGLKTAFTLGDEVWIQSNGRRMIQTLWAAGRGKAPRPGASPAPELDSEAPEKGCRITIPYRGRAVIPEDGEAIELRAPSTGAIETLFREICDAIPEQFAGVVSPPNIRDYLIRLRHWRFGEVRFAFRCTRPEKAREGSWIFRRQCTVECEFDRSFPEIREEVARKYWRPTGRLRDRMADFFRIGKHYFIEVSWPIDKRGRPRTGTGRFRYPIGYPIGSEAGLTRRGANFSAPFVSDTERHGPARNDPVNDELREASESLLRQVLATRLVPKHGPAGLKPLLPQSPVEHRKDKTREALAYLAKRSAIPSASRPEALRVLSSGGKGRAESAVRELESGRGRAAKRRYRFVIPVASWDISRVHSGLATLCPRQEPQIHPFVDGRLIELLVDGGTDGWKDLYVSFDELDAIALATGSGNQWFEPSSAHERGSPILGKVLLDLISDVVDRNLLNQDTRETLQREILVPTSTGASRRLCDVYRGVSLPEDVPGVDLPPIIHSNLAGHRLLKRRGWRLRKYALSDFLDADVLVRAPERTRRRFWKWLSANARTVPATDRRRLARMPVWPDSNGYLRCLADLCEPRSRSIAQILRPVINRPSSEVRKCPIVSIGSRKTTAVRQQPSPDELTTWLDRYVTKLVVGREATSTDREMVRELEAGLAAMLSDATIAPVLKTLSPLLPTESSDGRVRHRNELAAPTTATRRLALPPNFLAQTGRDQGLLDKLCARLYRPTPDMLISALETDPWNIGALQARLREFIEVTEPVDKHRRRLRDLAILPIEGRLCAPGTVAFKGQGPDYWGEWKGRLGATGLSQDDQKRYKDIGVTGARPTEETSRHFFTWLATQEPKVVERHLPCVIRHFLLHNGPKTWAQSYTNIQCIPTNSRQGVELVSVRFARRSPVLVDDEHDLAREITARDSRVRFVIPKVSEVREPATPAYRTLGVRSLREQVGEPTAVTGSGGGHETPTQLREALKTIQSQKFRHTFIKRLDDIGVDKVAIRTDWQSRIMQIREVRVTDDVHRTYRYRNKDYRLASSCGFDPEGQTLWLRYKEGSSVAHLYEAVAAERIFKPGTPRILLFALTKAVELESGDASYGTPLVLEPESSEETDAEKETRDDVDNDEVGESTHGHSPFHPDPSRNRPDPAPFSPDQQEQKSQKPKSDNLSSGRDVGTTRRDTPEIEQRHIDELKRSHYASHCQVCLCFHSPEDLAPEGSYVEWEEVRRRIVEAHHVDPKAGGGLRNAANLILLCRYHHDNLGRRLSRKLVRAALEDSARATTVTFRNDIELAGYIATVTIQDTGEPIPVFFTSQHAQYWLDQQ